MEKIDYSTFEKNRSVLLDRAKHNYAALDSSLISVSSGTLVLTLTLTTGLLKETKLLYGWLLPTGWIFLLFTIIAVIVSYKLAIKDIELEIQKQDTYYSEKSCFSYEKTKYRHWTNIINISSLVCFMLGMAAIVTFSAVNIGEKI